MSLAYYMGLPYKLNVSHNNGLYTAWIEEFGEEVSGTADTEEEAKRKCQDAKHEFLKTMIKNEMYIPEPINKQTDINTSETKSEIENQYSSENIKNTNREDELVQLLNKLFKLKDIKYNDLNSIVPFSDKVSELRKLEKENPDLVLARYDEPEEGITTLSLIATITRYICGKPLAFEVDGPEDDYIITGAYFLNENK